MIMQENKKINEIARDYAIKCHTETNHLYNGKSYRVHLEMVVNVAEQYLHLIPEEYRDEVQAACWVHDVIEDCRQTYNDVKAATNDHVAELAYALTNEKGRNRKERANHKYYEGIITTRFARFIKCCDRIANVSYSKESGSSMFKMYQKENREFVIYMHHKDYDELFAHLNNICSND
jgi:(p)ppGpp synthase/HD superfamily hydrolase